MDAKGRLAAVRDVAAQHKRLCLLVLHGSRSGGNEHAGSDWDFGYQGQAGLDTATLHSALTRTLGTDAVDLTDLDRASALLRFEAARRGRCIYERVPARSRPSCSPRPCSGATPDR